MFEIKKSEFKPEKYSKLTLLTNHRNGNQTYSYEDKCERCNGLGKAISHIHNGQPVFHRPDDGICYECWGKGTVVRKFKVVTDENWNEKIHQEQLTREQILENIRKHTEQVIASNIALGYKKVDFTLASWFSENPNFNINKYYRIAKETEKAYLIEFIDSLESTYSNYDQWFPKKAIIK